MEYCRLLFCESCAILCSRLRLCLSSPSGNRSRVGSAQAGPFLLFAYKILPSVNCLAINISSLVLPYSDVATLAIPFLFLVIWTGTMIERSFSSLISVKTTILSLGLVFDCITKIGSCKAIAVFAIILSVSPWACGSLPSGFIAVRALLFNITISSALYPNFCRINGEDVIFI